MANKRADGESALVFQDVWNASTKTTQDDDDDDDTRLSELFFELANVEFVGYRVEIKNNKQEKEKGVSDPSNEESTKISDHTQNNRIVWIQQDFKSCHSHTGGIIWETSYLLANYFMYHAPPEIANHRILEVGAGCGLLGQVLAFLTNHQVVLTECQPVLQNLKKNLARNENLFTSNSDSSSNNNNNSSSKNNNNNNSLQIHRPEALELDWTCLDQCQLRPRSFDTIVGTDVLFAPSLVKPLLETLTCYATSFVYLCLQIRCPDSYPLFLQLAPDYGWALEELSLNNVKGCQWGVAMECHLWKLTKVSKWTEDEDNGGKTEGRKKEKTMKKKKKKKKRKHNEGATKSNEARKKSKKNSC